MGLCTPKMLWTTLKGCLALVVFLCCAHLAIIELSSLINPAATTPKNTAVSTIDVHLYFSKTRDLLGHAKPLTRSNFVRVRRSFQVVLNNGRARPAPGLYAGRNADYRFMNLVATPALDLCLLPSPTLIPSRPPALLASSTVVEANITPTKTGDSPAGNIRRLAHDYREMIDIAKDTTSLVVIFALARWIEACLAAIVSILAYWCLTGSTALGSLKYLHIAARIYGMTWDCICVQAGQYNIPSCLAKLYHTGYICSLASKSVDILLHLLCRVSAPIYRMYLRFNTPQLTRRAAGEHSFVEDVTTRVDVSQAADNAPIPLEPSPPRIRKELKIRPGQGLYRPGALQAERTEEEKLERAMARQREAQKLEEQQQRREELLVEQDIIAERTLVDCLEFQGADGQEVEVKILKAPKRNRRGARAGVQCRERRRARELARENEGLPEGSPVSECVEEENAGGV